MEILLENYANFLLDKCNLTDLKQLRKIEAVLEVISVSVQNSTPPRVVLDLHIYMFFQSSDSCCDPLCFELMLLITLFQQKRT